MTPLRRIILDEVRVASKKSPNEFGYKADESGEMSTCIVIWFLSKKIILQSVELAWFESPVPPGLTCVFRCHFPVSHLSMYCFYNLNKVC